MPSSINSNKKSPYDLVVSKYLQFSFYLFCDKHSFKSNRCLKVLQFNHHLGVVSKLSRIMNLNSWRAYVELKSKAIYLPSI